MLIVKWSIWFHHPLCVTMLQLLLAQEVDPVQELKDKIYRMQQVLGRPDRAQLVSDTDSDREEDEDCEPALRPLLDRGYNLPLARKACCWNKLVKLSETLIVYHWQSIDLVHAAAAEREGGGSAALRRTTHAFTNYCPFSVPPRLADRSARSTVSPGHGFPSQDSGAGTISIPPYKNLSFSLHWKWYVDLDGRQHQYHHPLHISFLQALVRSQYDLLQAAEWLTEQQIHGAE